MSVKSRQNEVVRFMKELAGLRKQEADEAKKEAAKIKAIDQANRSLQTARSDSMMRNFGQKLVRLSDDLAKIKSKRAQIVKKLADKLAKLHQAEIALSNDQETERKRVIKMEKTRERAQMEHQQRVKRELSRQLVPSSTNSVQFQLPQPNRDYDAFICHASEDKEELVLPLSVALKTAGFKIWFDTHSLEVGDSLRESIDRGLYSSRYGIVVLSSAFFSKNWTQYELNGLVNKEMKGQKVVLPIWHKVSKDEVGRYSPSLADKVAINTSLSTINEIVDQLSGVLARR